MVFHKQKIKTLVCDIGSGSIKVGIAGNLSPHKIIPCLAGWPKNSSTKETDSERKMLIGNDALEKGKFQKIGYSYAMSATGNVQDWKSLELLLVGAFRDFCILDFSKWKLLITRPYRMKEEDLKKLMDIFLVNFGFHAITMHEQAALVLYTQGVETGIVVEIGESSTNIIPVYKGHGIPKLYRSLAIGGRSISSYLLKLLRLKGFQLNDEEDLEIGRQIKERVCYVALDPTAEEHLAIETTILKESFKLPDGTIISVGRERFGAVETLFQPSLDNCESNGLSDMIFEVIQTADIDCRADFYSNIIISGGSTLFPGLKERLQRDLTQRYINDVLGGNTSRLLCWKPQIQAPCYRQHLVFEGASLFGDFISDDDKYWVSRKDYLLNGMQRVLDKCLTT